jgi:hypothetical protein
MQQCGSIFVEASPPISFVDIQDDQMQHSFMNFTPEMWLGPDAPLFAVQVLP